MGAPGGPGGVDGDGNQEVGESPAPPPPPPPPVDEAHLTAVTPPDQRTLIVSRLEAREPDKRRLKRDILDMASYFAKVGFNTGMYIKNPLSAELSEKLDHKRITRLINKYQLKMNVDEKFTWTYYRDLGEKLRIFDLVLAYFDTFIDRAAATSPVDFDEERFWKCAGNRAYWLACQRKMKKQNGYKNAEVRAQHSSSRLLTVAILPLLNDNNHERTLITLCALSVEVRKGPLDNERYQHFYRECHRHVKANAWGRDYAELKAKLRLKFGIEQAALELERIEDGRFHQLWELTSKKSQLPYPVDFERFVSKSICVKHMEGIETSKATLMSELKLLAKHFSRPNAELLLKECQKFSTTTTNDDDDDDEAPLQVDAASRRTLELLDKYRIWWSPIINQFSIKKWKPDKRISIDGLAREYLQLFIDTAAASSATLTMGQLDYEQEVQFWRCANNFPFWQKYSKLAAKHASSRKSNAMELVCQLAPGRLLACGFYRLLTPDEPKLIELCALRGALGPERQSYEYFKHNLLYQIKRPLDKSQAEHKQKLRLRYKVAEAEAELAACDLESFLKHRRQDEEKCLSSTINLLSGGVGGGNTNNNNNNISTSNKVDTWKKPVEKYLRLLEPNEQQLRSDLIQLVRFFNNLGSIYLLDNRNRLRDQLKEPERQDQVEVRMYNLAYKYRVIYSRIRNTRVPANFNVRLHRLVSDHLMLFIDTAALASWAPPAGAHPISADERRFWWCAQNLNYLQRATEAMRQCRSYEQVLKVAPLRLVSIGTYRLLKLSGESNLLKLNALRAAIERPGRLLSEHHIETLMKDIEKVNEKLENSQRELISELRARYQLDKAEAELAPIDVELFLKRWNSPTWQQPEAR